MKEKMLEAAWQNLVKKYNLNLTQLEQFKLYLKELILWNNKFNITAIVDEVEVINYHFKDSLALAQFIDLDNLHTIADVGSGGGFPGLPLKILYPHLKLVLIEVNGKKVEFLQNLAQTLGLSDVIVYQIDWRAFIRECPQEVDLFCARASLQVEELLRIYKPGCAYKNSQLVYWASQNWDGANFATLIGKVCKYGVGNRERQLIFFPTGALESLIWKKI